MMFFRVAKHLRHGGGVLLAGLMLAPGVSQAGDSGPSLIPGDWGAPGVISLGLIGVGCLALLSVLLTFGDAGMQRRRRSIRGRIDKLDLPAAISGVDGKLDWSNPALRAAFGDGQGDIVQTLGRGIEVDAGLVYRLAVRARKFGFAFEPVRSLHCGMAALSVRFDEPKHLVWMVLPSGHFPNIEQHGSDSTYENAPFAHMRIDRDGNATANLQLREIYGNRPGFLADLIDHDQAQVLRRVPLPRSDGETQFCNTCIVPAADGDVMCREIFIFPAGAEVEDLASGQRDA